MTRHYWIAAWPQVVHAKIYDRDLFSLPQMKILRGVEPDLIYFLLSPLIVEVEMTLGKTEIERIRAWGDALLLGKSTHFPPWRHVPVAPDRLGALSEELEVFGISLVDNYRCMLFSRLLDACIQPTSWEDFARNVLDLLTLDAEEQGTTKLPTIRCYVLHAAMRDLRSALDEGIAPAAALALETLGWPLPWVP